MTQPNPESLPIIADYGIKSVLRQLADADTLSARGYQIAGFASVVLGLAAVNNRGPEWLLGIIIGAYCASLAACLWVVRPRQYDSPGSPADLWRMKYDLPPNEVWLALVDCSASAYVRNAKTAERRWRWLEVALGALAIETLFVGVRLWAA